MRKYWIPVAGVADVLRTIEYSIYGFIPEIQFRCRRYGLV
jgi:hypothetical protein